MQITYIPPVVASTSKNILQTTIENAITNTIVLPLKEWCYETISKGIMLAEWGLIFACATGVIFWICGIQKGKKVTIVCTLIYIGLQVVKVVFM